MATVNIIGSRSSDFEEAKFIVAEAYAAAHDMLADLLRSFLLRSFATAADIPDNLKISDGEPGGWHGAEQEIDKAVKRGDWLTALNLTDNYKARIRRFCTAWEARIAAGKGSK